MDFFWGIALGVPLGILIWEMLRKAYEKVKNGKR
jgi:hypothetical protein